MKHLIWTVLLLAFLLSGFAVAQDTEPLSCDDYIQKLEGRLSVLNTRLESFVYTVSSLRSDYIAWQDLRIQWYNVAPPECAVALNTDVITMFASLGDISMHSLYLKLDPESASGQRLAREAVARARVRISDVADGLEALSGAAVDVDSVLAALNDIAFRLQTAD